MIKIIDDKEVSEISEICRLVIEMKNMNECMIERMDKLELIFLKNIV